MLGNMDVVIKPVKVEVEVKDLECSELGCKGICEQELKAGVKRLIEEEHRGQVPQMAEEQNLRHLFLQLIRQLLILFCN